MRRASIILALAVLAALLPAAADARPRAPEVWATVNVCDTATSPDKMGIRGSMTGLRRRSRLYMRFRVQYRDLEGRWTIVREGADSDWRRVHVGRRGTHDMGWSFTFRPPPPGRGGAYVLRGLVTFQWRRGKRVVARERARTEAGHPGTTGADPDDFSAATCEIA